MRNECHQLSGRKAEPCIPLRPGGSPAAWELSYQSEMLQPDSQSSNFFFLSAVGGVSTLISPNQVQVGNTRAERLASGQGRPQAHSLLTHSSSMAACLAVPRSLL